MLISNLIKKEYIESNDVVKDNNPILRKKCEQVTIPICDEVSVLGRKMLEHVIISQDKDKAEKLKIRSAVGIAANQLGVSIQMIAIHVEDEVLSSYVLINPKIIAHSQKLCALKNGESCLSVKDGLHEGIVHRFYKIKVKGFSLIDNKELILEFSGYTSIVVQHELDHLKGLLYFDHINKKDPWYIKPQTIII